MAHSGGRITVKYPSGYDPAVRSFIKGAAASAAAAPGGAETAAEAERRRKRQERFGGVAAEAAAAPATCGGGVSGKDEDDYEARYKQAHAEQARLRAEFAARKRANAEAGLGVTRAGVGKKKKPGKQSAAAPRGVLDRLSLPGGGDELRKQLQSRRAQQH
jgi:hypothetical protein